MYELRFNMRQAYGNTRYYPSCEPSTRILSLFKVKSLTPTQVVELGKALGLQIKITVMMPNGEIITQQD